MIYRLNAADISGPVRLRQGAWLRSRLPGELGECINDICQLDDGLALAYTHYHPRLDLLETSAIERENRVLTIVVALEGESSILGGDGQRFDFVAGHSTLAALSSGRGERRFSANQPVRQLRLIANEALLQRFQLEHLLEGVGAQHRFRHISFSKDNGATQRLAHTLLHLHRRNAGRLELQIAALGLLAEQTRAFLPACAQTSKLSPDDQEKILRAREILLNEYAQPLTIAYLSAAVGTNDFKLKQGFRELFDTSPYRLLTSVRMEKARELLEMGARVSTAAYQVGYQHLSSFSTAFERYYGHVPKSVAHAGRERD
ncbi:helix-turn-helix transcriptional regulator [Kerstersia gyiorum]|uniref:helix-turn-helix transcriptional regulator n=1 Tax=Kerstersia gyiorum TaxID=206506 RepID=UPI003B431516